MPQKVPGGVPAASLGEFEGQAPIKPEELSASVFH